MKHKQNLYWVCIVLMLLGQSAFTKKKKKRKEATPTATTSNAPTTKIISSIIGKCKAYSGLFNLYQDEKDGTTYILIKKDQMNKEFIYFTHTVDGVLDAGTFRRDYVELFLSTSKSITPPETINFIISVPSL